MATGYGRVDPAELARLARSVTNAVASSRPQAKG